MQAWIAAVCHTTFQLEAADFEVGDLDLIIALTQGLLESYSSFTISLNSTPLKDLNVNFIITCLLNEESWQQGIASTAPIKPDPDFHIEGSIMLAQDAKHSLDIVCFNCRGKGHVAWNCPLPWVKEIGGAAVEELREVADMAHKIEIYDDDLSCWFHNIVYLEFS